MKALEFSHLLRALESLVADSSERNVVAKIADAFSRGGGTTVAVLLGRLAPARATHPPADAVVSSLSISQLKRTLAQADKLLAAAGAKTASGDLQSLIKALPTTSHPSLTDWLTSFDNVLASPTKRAKSGKVPALPPAEQVATYVKRFNDAGYDKDSFLAAHASLGSDSMVKAAEAKEIVQRVTQLTRKHSSKSKALEFLLEDFYGRLRRHNELANVSKARPW